MRKFMYPLSEVFYDQEGLVFGIFRHLGWLRITNISIIMFGIINYTK